MDSLPGDEKARRERLEEWAGAQQRRLNAERHLNAWRGSQLKPKRALRQPDSLLDSRLVARLLDRGLHSSDVAVEREHYEGDRSLYWPSSWHVLPRALRYVGVSDRDTFVDFGCGKGRVVHQAARRPFSRVIGVEISPALAEVARDGLAARSRQHQCGNVEIVVCDVADYRIPDDLTIGYFFHPFIGETFDAVIRNVVASIEHQPRRVWLIYVNPVLGGQILATGRFRLVKWLRGGLRDKRLDRAAIFQSR
jgi:SAM-dependent methyltransferase